jgi:hypothetical protein
MEVWQGLAVAISTIETSKRSGDQLVRFDVLKGAAALVLKNALAFTLLHRDDHESLQTNAAASNRGGCICDLHAWICVDP